MKVADTLFINGAIKRQILDVNHLISLSDATLCDRLRNAEHVVIISAYYDLTFLRTLFERKTSTNRNITMVFARPAPSALRQQIPELIEFQKELLRKERNSNINTAISGNGPFLHTKLYQFRRRKWMRTLIGSANSTSNGFDGNDEILIEVQGRSLSIDEYVNRTLAAACNCEDVDISENEEYTSFQSMLRDGYVYFKAARSLPYHLNCFDNKPSVVVALQKAVVGNPLPFHEGQSVGMLNILRLLNIEGSDQTAGQEAAQRVKIVPIAVETAFGYWVPSSYQARLEERLGASAEKRTKALLKCGRRLSSKNDEVVSRDIRTKYLAKIDERLQSVTARRLASRDQQDIETRILRRVHGLQQRLRSETECQRLAQSLNGTPVPEIWEDPQSTNEMISSFCEYVSWKLSSPTRIPRIVQTLRHWFDLVSGDDPDDIRGKIDNFFKSHTVNREDWGGVILHYDDEEVDE